MAHAECRGATLDSRALGTGVSIGAHVLLLGPGAGTGHKGGIGGGVYVDGDNGVTSPRLVREIKPNYTAAAVGAKVQGSVLLEAVVLPDGSVDPDRIRIVRALDAPTGLDQQAVLAVRAGQFRPGMFEGKPVTVRVLVELTFTLR